MRAPTMLLVDADTQRSCHNQCSRLPHILHIHFPHLSIQTFTGSRSSLHSQPKPSIILFRPSNVSALAQRVVTFREQWPQAWILGLICDHPPSSILHHEHWFPSFDDFLICPFQETDLILRLRRALACVATRSRMTDHSEPSWYMGTLIGSSPIFRQAIEKIPLLAHCDATVLILGETGTGKELVARAVHYHSFRRGKPFIPVNCGALPDHLFENELFGHSKGAFTDAGTEHKGLLAEAEGGTLFLDEIDSLSMSAQVKLLRVLQEREYRPLGSAKALKANVRLLAASNAPLHQKVEDQTFREDLFYRLNILSLSLPSLRERVEDIPALTHYFLTRYNRQLGKSVSLTPEAIQKLLMYHWPGNVRELEAVLQRAVTLSTTSRLGPQNLELGSGVYTPLARSLSHAKSLAIAQCERTYLTAVLMAHRGNISRAAQAAGKDRRSFQRLIKKYGLDRRVFSPPS
ncbi:MAG: sigma-54-dependent Fis family transcriptional regulator [Nitrospirae bacterium]|nr:MAG: sigma-54-dependent Fis family transcriptional regulator [Nitrospirota bacterium]